MTARNLKEKLLDLFHDAKPFLDYINRAVEYAQEEKRAGWRD